MHLLMYPANTTILSAAHPKNTFNIFSLLPETLTVNVFEVLLGADVTQGLFQSAVVDGLLFGLGEKVGHDAVEELQVVLQELWHVDVLNGSQTDQLLGDSEVEDE